MKLLLFYPNTANKFAVTLAIPILSGIAKKYGWEIHYFDTTLYKRRDDSIEDKEKTGGFMPVEGKKEYQRKTHEQLILDFQEKLDTIKPDLLCITAMSCEFEYLMTFFPEIVIPNETTVAIGGVHSTICSLDVASTGLFDLVCSGQGEEVFEDILTKKQNNENLYDIRGIYYLDEITEDVVRNPPRKLLSAEELWKTDVDYSVYGEEYFDHPFDGKIVKMGWMEVGRGCPWSCAYCGNSALKECYRGLGRYVHNRPLDSTFRNFRTMIDDFGVEIFNFTAECFLAQPKKRLRDFAKRYAEEVKKPFLIQTRSETVSEESLDILKSFGAPFFQVGMGVESGSERIVNEICNRRANLDDVIRAYDLLNKYSIRSNAYFMIGFPTETREDIFKTIDLCRRIKSHINCVSIFQPLPGVPLTQMCIDKGYITGKEGLETFTSTSVLKMPQLSAKEIENLRRVFLLYAKLPEKYHKDIEKCELDYENNKDLFDELVSLRWEHDKR